MIRLPRDADGEIPLALILYGNHPDAGGWVIPERTTFDQQADA
jgi:polyhydroxybutyrate depolymerase